MKSIRQFHTDKNTGFCLEARIASRKEPRDKILPLAVRMPCFFKWATMQGGCLQPEEFGVRSRLKSELYFTQ